MAVLFNKENADTAAHGGKNSLSTCLGIRRLYLYVVGKKEESEDVASYMGGQVVKAKETLFDGATCSGAFVPRRRVPHCGKRYYPVIWMESEGRDY